MYVCVCCRLISTPFGQEVGVDAPTGVGHTLHTQQQEEETKINTTSGLEKKQDVRRVYILLPRPRL